MRATAVLLALSSAQLLAGCKTSGSGAHVAAADDSAAASVFRTKAEAAAKTLLQKYNNYELQTETRLNDDCHPLIIDADPSVPFKGTAILFHGYTNCPQQFNELGAILAKKGIQTFAPLSPGHGRMPVPLDINVKQVNGVNNSDYYGEFLPMIENDGWRTYQHYVADVNTFAKSLGGMKVVSGLSLGGGMATYAYLESPGLYERALLTSPFYGPAGSYAGRNKSDPGNNFLKRLAADTLYQIESFALKDLAKDIKVVGAHSMSWGASCYQNDQGGRRGICDFRIDNLAAVVANGGDALERLKTVDGAKLPTKVQYIITEWDKAADSRLMRQAAALQQGAASSDQVKICAYPHQVPHSFFSRTDILSIANPYWLNSFLQISTDYLAFGDEIPLDLSTPSQEVAFDIQKGDDSDNFLKRCSIYDLPLDQAVKERQGG